MSRPQPSGAGSTSQVVVTAPAWETAVEGPISGGSRAVYIEFNALIWVSSSIAPHIHLTLPHGWCLEGMGHINTGRGKFCRAWCRMRVGSPCGIRFRFGLIESLFL